MKKTNNKGFTMTEVIVAVAVFLILALPILSQLVLSVKNNSKAKSSQYGINVAESEMELFKSVDLNALSKIYDRTDTLDSSGSLIKTVYSLPGKYLDGTKIKEEEFMKSPYATPALLEFAKKVQSFEQDKDGICTFKYVDILSNTDTASAENETSKSFDVVVTLNPTEYAKGEGDPLASPVEKYNSKREGAVQNLNKDEQAIIGSDLSTKDQKARDDFWNDVLNNSPDGMKLTAQEYQMYNTPAKTVPSRFRVGTFWMHRTTYITIEENFDSAFSTLGKYVVTYRYVYDAKIQVGSQWYQKQYPGSETKLYYNTVPDVKFLYNQLVVSKVGNATQQSSDVIFDDSIEFTNKLSYEKTHSEGTGGTGYQYYYTNSDIYIVANLDACRGYSNVRKCEITLGSEHQSTQNQIKVYYSETASGTKTIKDNLKVNALYDSVITIEDSAKKVVKQEFQPIYDIVVKVHPTNNKGMDAKLEGTRGQ